MLHLICIFTFYRDTFSGHAAVIADDPFYVLSHCAQCSNAEHIAPVIKSVRTLFFSVYLYEIRDDSAPAGMHILEQTMIIWRYTVQIYSLQAGVCK